MSSALRVVLAATFACIVGCSFGDVDLSGKSCPCADGYLCDPVGDRCVAALSDAGTDSVPPGDTGSPSDTGIFDTSTDTSTPSDTSTPLDTAPPDTGPGPRDTACDGALSSYDFCDGFEVSGLGMWDEHYEDDGDSYHVTDPTYRGRGAFGANTTGPDSYAVHLNHPFWLSAGQELYFRFYLMVPPTTPLDEFAIFSSSSDEAFADQMTFGIVDGHAAGYVGPIDMEYSGVGSSFPQDRWVCVQGHFAVGDGTGTMQMSWDGESVLDASGFANVPTAPYVHLVIGVIAADQSTTQVYIDEIAADDTTPIPCDP